MLDMFLFMDKRTYACNLEDIAFGMTTETDHPAQGRGINHAHRSDSEKLPPNTPPSHTIP